MFTCLFTEYIYKLKNLYVYIISGYKEFLWNIVLRLGLFLWFFKVILIYMCERLILGNIYLNIRYYMDIIRMFRKGDFIYNIEIINIGICIWIFIIVDIDL